MNTNDLKKALQMVDFYLLELNLYLDTHPLDTNALSKFDEYKTIREKISKQYVSNYGPISAADAVTENGFNWVNDPWPWERSAN